MKLRYFRCWIYFRCDFHFHLAAVEQLLDNCCFGCRQQLVTEEEKTRMVLTTPHADPVKRDQCWIESFPSEVGVELHAPQIFNRDAGGEFSKF